MARRADPVAVIWAQAPMALSFLTDDWGFSGPELTADGVAYHRVGLHVEMSYWAWKDERGLTTTLAQVGIDGTERPAELGVIRATPEWCLCAAAHRSVRDAAAHAVTMARRSVATAIWLADLTGLCGTFGFELG